MPTARVSILNVDETIISPLKFRGWLRAEMQSIQETARSKDDIIVVKLYIGDRLRYAVTQATLDKMLHGVVNTHPNIYRVELEKVAKALTIEELAGVSKEAQAELQASIAALENDGQNPLTLH